MKGSVLGLASMLWVATTTLAHAERDLGGYRDKDAGTLVISFSNPDSRDGGTIIERSDWTASVQIHSSPRPGQHDFTEDYDSSAFIASTGLRGLDSPGKKFYGKVEIVKLPPGLYHFWRPDRQPAVLGRLAPISPDFEIQTGRTTYVGEYRTIDLWGKNRLGLRVSLYYAIEHLNMADRDLAIAKSVGVNVDNPIIIGPDIPAVSPKQ